MPRPLVLLIATTLPCLAQSVSTDSPFLGMPVGGPGATAPQAAGDIEFVGVLGAGDQAQFGFVRKSTQKSFWVSLGRENEGLKVLRREGSDHVVVQTGAETQTLILRSATVSRTPTVVFTPPPVPAVARPAGPAPATNAPQPPLVQPDPATAEKEREARMLVSDLLEIGMQQRKAYEEAQKKKAAEAAKGVAPKSQ